MKKTGSRRKKKQRRQVTWLGASIVGVIVLLAAFLQSPGAGENDGASGISGGGVSASVTEDSSTSVLQAQAVGEEAKGQSLEQSGGDVGTSPGQEASQGSGQPLVEASAGADGVEDELEVHFLDVGQGDATLILCGGEAMLIDAGDNSQGTRVQNYLEKQGVEALKYAVCTHPDEDHIGGMDVILYKFNCETVFMTEEEKDTNTYRDVVDTMAQKGYSPTLPVVGAQYALGDAVFTILGPEVLGDDSNNNSIALLLAHGDNNFLFTGDAEEEEEEALVNGLISLDVDVYKAGHHGSRTSSCAALLEVASPAWVVISCGEGNSYGHPHAETMNQLRAMGVSVYRTDEQGTIVAVSDGAEIAWNCSPSTTWQAGEPTGSAKDSTAQTGQEDSSAGTGQGSSEELESEGESSVAVSSGQSSDVTAVAPAYICNTNTHKFHYPDCGSVKQMKEENKLPTNATREELVGQGYEPCKKCKP